MSKEEIIERTVYSKEYDDSENVFVKENESRGDVKDVDYVIDISRRCMRNLIVKKCIQFSEKYHISLCIKEDDHFLFVAFAFGKYMYVDFLKPIFLVCEDVFILHEDDKTIVELIYCIDEMAEKN